MIWLAFLKRVDQNAKKTYGELYDQEQKLFQPLPETRFQACTYDTLRVDKRSTVPHAKSRYSVPVQYATKHVVLRAFVDRIEVHFEDQIIATHERMEPGQWSLQLSHYIALLETNPLLQQSETGIRSLDCYDSLIDSRPDGHDDQGFIDPSVGEPVSSPFARNAIDDKIQESHSHSNGILSGIGIPPSLTETSLNALGISEHSQAMLIG